MIWELAMARGEHLSSYDCFRIRALAARGLSDRAIAKALGRSRQSVWRVRNGRRDLPVWLERFDMPSAADSQQLETSMPIRLETRIGLGVPDKEISMATPELIQQHFIDVLSHHFVVSRRAADCFFADLISALVDEQCTVPVLQRAARTFIRTRAASSFPAVASCIAACRAAQIELSGDSVSNPEGHDAGAKTIAARPGVDSEEEAA